VTPDAGRIGIKSFPNVSHGAKSAANPYAMTVNAALFAPWETFGKLLMPILPASGVTEKSFSQWKEVFATFSFGWAVGKIVAASSSQKATKLFCQLNSLPMTYFVYCCHKAQTFDWPTWALFLTAYVYFGYLAK
jgi:hypothetical protein